MPELDTSGRVAAVEGLLEEIESLDEPGRSVATDTVQALLELYGEAFARVLDAVGDAGARERLLSDDLVSHLLLVHGLHPVDVETRVAEALDGVRPYLDSHGGGVELLGIADGVAHLRLQGSCDGCPSSAMTLRLAVEEAILKAAPEIERVEAEGAVAEQPAPLLALTPVLRSPAAARNGHASRPEEPWAIAGALPELAARRLLVKEVAGEPVLFLRLDGSYLAYRHRCPGCDEPLGDATLDGAELTCGCGRRFDVRRAGRCLDEPALYLEPIPLLVTDAGLVKVAVTAAGR